MSDTLPDIEGALRTWLRAQSPITALVGQRVFFGVPKGATEVTFPLITVQLVDASDDASEAPLTQALVQFDVWGSIDESGNGKKAETTVVVNTLRSVLRTVRGRTALTASVAAFGIDAVGIGWSPDPDNDRPRYVVTAEVTAVST